MPAISIHTVLDQLLNQQQLDLSDVIDRHFSPHYRQRTNGVWDDRTAFTQHIRKLREVVASVRIEVLDELRDGNRYADRHCVYVTKRDGSTVVQEVYLFGELDHEGRFLRIEETTLMLEGAEADRNIGSVK
ncbi:nuclear transport factor 2 family protein [Paenalcaligenes suwonensis]|uniref:nuclear transport factor 2 family protein n=1 Tax=Paenalcaligenes suwonensis TaxID=1202713 RepID=UPI00140CB39C|nr:nuclear transport factor 2 family protein [Paenalcaligenes suwonensis]NHC63042.1 nuclear transport factor 2 family protein [Paenalcaligenes suwonensis]